MMAWRAPTRELAATPDDDRPTRVAGLHVTTADQAPVVTVNDNRGRLFPLMQMSDKSVIADDPSLYPDGHGARLTGGVPIGLAAIGEIRPSDVTVLTLDSPYLVGGVLPTARTVLPAGLPALYSFAELLKRGAHMELDIHPDELEVGLQAIRMAGVQTHRIFLADALENGAGYASEIGRPERLSLVLTRILGDIATASGGAQPPRHLQFVMSELSPKLGQPTVP